MNTIDANGIRINYRIDGSGFRVTLSHFPSRIGQPQIFNPLLTDFPKG